MTAFCLYHFHGEIYDFEKENRDHKLLREQFLFGNFPIVAAG